MPGKRVSDRAAAAREAAGVEEVCRVGRWRIADGRAHCPDFAFRLNEDRPKRNILASLICVEDLMEAPSVTYYSDILVSADGVHRMLDPSGDDVVGVDTQWKAHDRERTQHPATEGRPRHHRVCKRRARAASLRSPPFATIPGRDPSG